MRIALLSILLVLAGTAAGATPRNQPAMVEIHKGRVFINLDRHVKNSQGFLVDTVRWTPIDPSFSWEARLGQRQLGGYRKGQPVSLFNATGKLATCRIKRFVFLNRAWELDYDRTAGETQKPLCGSPVLFGELHCPSARVAKIGAQAIARVGQVATLPRTHRQLSAPSAIQRLKTACLNDAEVLRVASIAQRKALKKHAALKRRVTTEVFSDASGQRLVSCAVTFYTGMGETICGGDDVVENIHRVFRQSGSNRLVSLWHYRPTDGLSISYIADVDGDGVLDVVGKLNGQRAIIRMSKDGARVINQLSVDTCGCPC